MRRFWLAHHTGIRNTGHVILVIPDPGLAQLAASPVLLAQLWPGAWEEVMFLLQMLRLSVPSLAEALTVGLISVLIPPAETLSAQIFLAYRTVVLSAVAHSQAGDRVTTPHLRPADIWRLEITDLSAGGRSGLRLAG